MRFAVLLSYHNASLTCMYSSPSPRQRYNYAERVATCIDDYVQSSRRGGGRGGKSGGGKSLDGASADTGSGEAFSTGETVGWGCPRVRCVLCPTGNACLLALHAEIRDAVLAWVGGRSCGHYCQSYLCVDFDCADIAGMARTSISVSQLTTSSTPSPKPPPSQSTTE